MQKLYQVTNRNVHIIVRIQHILIQRSSQVPLRYGCLPIIKRTAKLVSKRRARRRRRSLIVQNGVNITMLRHIITHHIVSLHCITLLHHPPMLVIKELSARVQHRSQKSRGKVQACKRTSRCKEFSTCTQQVPSFFLAFY